MSDDIVKRLRAPTDDDGDLLQDAADALTAISARLAAATTLQDELCGEITTLKNRLTALAARLAECEAKLKTFAYNTAESVFKQFDIARAATARAEALEKALKPFAEIAENDIGDDESDADRFLPMHKYNRGPTLTVGMFRNARAALAKEAP
jgi:predicted  nucleic acid-binding Zn-ribbon protein